MNDVEDEVLQVFRLDRAFRPNDFDVKLRMAALGRCAGVTRTR